MVLELIFMIQVQPNRRGRLPAFFLYCEEVMKELSIFVDESGDVADLICTIKLIRKKIETIQPMVGGLFS